MQEKDFEYFTLRNADGSYKTVEDINEEAMRAVADALENLSEDDQLEIGNEWRDEQNYTRLNPLDEYTVNEMLDGVDPWELLHYTLDRWDDYFTFDGFDFCTTSDVWEDIDVDDLAEEIVRRDFRPAGRYLDIECIMDEYDEAVEFLENLNEYREMAREVMAKFTNCEADWRDLYAMLDKLVNTDDAWAD